MPVCFDPACNDKIEWQITKPSKKIEIESFESYRIAEIASLAILNVASCLAAPEIYLGSFLIGTIYQIVAEEYKEVIEAYMGPALESCSSGFAQQLTKMEFPYLFNLIAATFSTLEHIAHHSQNHYLHELAHCQISVILTAISTGAYVTKTFFYSANEANERDFSMKPFFRTANRTTPISTANSTSAPIDPILIGVDQMEKVD